MEPEIAASRNAHHVNEIRPLYTRVKGCWRLLRPSNRRSTRAMLPNTSVRESTCTVSMMGNTHSGPGSSPRTKLEMADSWIACAMSAMFMGLRLRLSGLLVERRGVADHTAAHDDGDP